MQGLGWQGIGPTDERGVIRYRGPGQPAEPAQDQVLVHLLFGFLRTALMQVLDDEQASEHFQRGGVPPMHQRGRMPLAKVGLHLPSQRIVGKPVVQLFEEGVDAFGHLRHPRKHIFCLRAVNKHLAFLLHAVLARFLLSFRHVACSHTASQAHFAPHTRTREWSENITTVPRALLAKS